MVSSPNNNDCQLSSVFVLWGGLHDFNVTVSTLCKKCISYMHMFPGCTQYWMLKETVEITSSFCGLALKQFSFQKENLLNITNWIHEMDTWTNKAITSLHSQYKEDTTLEDSLRLFHIPPYLIISMLSKGDVNVPTFNKYGSWGSEELTWFAKVA